MRAGSTATESFVADLIIALRAWQADSRLPVTTLLLAVATALPGLLAMISSTVSSLALFLIYYPAILFLVGFSGAQRLWYLRLFRHQVFNLSEAWNASSRYFGPYLVLGLVGTIPFLPFIAAWFYLLFSGVARHPGETSAQLPRHVSYWPSILLIIVPGLLLDFAGTFVTPALAFTTRSVARALRLGLGMIRSTWPAGALYVLFPPLVLQLVTGLPTSLIRSNRLLVAISAVVAVMVNLIAKGATAAFYLRRAEVGDSGSLGGEGPDPAATPIQQVSESMIPNPDDDSSS